MQAKWSKEAWKIKLKIDETLLLSNSSEAFGLIKLLFWQIAKDPTHHRTQVLSGHKTTLTDDRATDAWQTLSSWR